MAIEKYTTPCIVLDSYDSGEHDKMLVLFTRDFGVVSAKATSIRKLESKMRGHLLPRKTCLVTLVKGKEVWRVVGVDSSEVLPQLGTDATILLRRFIRGESQYKSHYDRVLRIVEFSKTSDYGKCKLLLYFVVLVDLGYADVTYIGVSSIEEYVALSVDQLYMHVLLSYDAVRSHVTQVLKEVQL
jgi:recombinational DNA repair protein (RecF pathway)